MLSGACFAVADSGLFWNAHFSHTFGLYYYVGETKYEVDFYQDKAGDELQYYNAKSTSDDKWENVTDNYVFSYIKNKGFNDGDNVLQCKPYTIKFPLTTFFRFRNSCTYDPHITDQKKLW